MPLRDVQISPSTKDRTLAKRLMDSWEHVENILRCFLPKSLSLDDCTKLVVNLRLDEEQTAEREYWQALRVGMLTVRGFDAGAYLLMSPDEQFQATLTVLDSAFDRLAELRGFDTATAHWAVRQVAATGGEYSWSSRKLSRSHRATRAKAAIVVSFRPGGTDLDAVLYSRLGTELERQRLVTAEYWPSVWFDYFVSAWEEADFVLKSRTGQETRRISWANLNTAAVEH